MAIGNILEPCMVGATFTLYACYHVYLWIRVRKDPMSTTIGHNHEVRCRWCELVIRERRDLLAIQTVRNTLMSSSLLASTSLTLSAIVGAYLVNTVSNQDTTGIDLLGAPALRPIHKFFGVILCFSVAFYCYMQSVRSTNHVGYMLNLVEDPYFTTEYVARVLNRGADFHTAGTRVFYLAFLCILWIFGPLPPTIVTIFLVPHLWYLDGAKSIGSTEDESPATQCAPINTSFRWKPFSRSA